MYHYVRPSAEGLPYFPYLNLTDFERQLDYFDRLYGFVSRDAFVRWVEGGPAPSGVLLTFDDGLRDHSEFVLPSLRARGLFGLFYVSSGPERDRIHSRRAQGASGGGKTRWKGRSRLARDKCAHIYAAARKATAVPAHTMRVKRQTKRPSL